MGGDGTLRPVSQSETVLTATTSGGLSTIDTSTFEGGGGGNVDDDDEGDGEDEIDFPDSDEEEDSEIVLLRQEVTCDGLKPRNQNRNECSGISSIGLPDRWQCQAHDDSSMTGL